MYDSAVCGQAFREVISMSDKDFGLGNGITTLFSQALTENRAAIERFDAMTADEKRAVIERARKIETIQEMKALVDDLVGFQEGGPPYQR